MSEVRQQPMTADDLAGLSADERLRHIEWLLGLLPGGSGWIGRVRYLAFLLASGAPADQLCDVLATVEEQQPGYLDRVERFIDQYSATGDTAP